MKTGIRNSALVLIIFLTCPLSASINAELFTSSAMGGDLGHTYGGGGSLSWSITEEYGFITRTYMTTRDEKRYSGGAQVDIRYEYLANLYGMEFYIPGTFLDNYRLKWKNSVCLGFSNTKVDATGLTVSEWGYAFFLCTGLQYVFYQHFSPFIEAGWYYSSYNDTFREANIQGAQINIGVRYSYDSSKSISSGY